MSGSLFVSLRVLHILVAALWLGAAGLLVTIVMPAIRDAGEAGGSLLASLHKRKLHAFMATTAVLTVLSGIWLYGMLTAGFSPAIVWSRSGLVFGIGGLCGVLAMVLGGSLIGPGFVRLAALAEQTAALPAVERDAHKQRIAATRQRTAFASKTALILIVAALVLMASGHYA